MIDETLTGKTIKIEGLTYAEVSRAPRGKRVLRKLAKPKWGDIGIPMDEYNKIISKIDEYNKTLDLSFKYKNKIKGNWGVKNKSLF